MEKKRKVVVTGMGLISPLGHTVDTSWKALCDSRSGIASITLFDTNAKNLEGCPVSIAGEVKHFDPTQALGGITPAKDIRRTSRFIQFALVAAYEAFKDSFLDRDRARLNFDRIGTHIASGMGGLPEIEEIHRTLLEKGYKRISPFFIPQIIPNMAAGHVSIALGLRGPNLCTTTACASSAHSIGESFRIITRGDADVMLCGGSEATISPLGIGGFAAMRALSTRNETPETASRPYDVNRDGFVMSEGSAVLVLEEKEHALARGAKIYAEIAGFSATGDAHHMTTPSPGGEGGLRAMRLALLDAGMQSHEIDYVNSHATSTALGDNEEAHAIAELFRETKNTLHVSATKSMTGHLLGSSGAIEAIICVKAITDGIVPATINLDELDPELADLGLNFTRGVSVRKEVRATVSNSFGFGGTNACLIFRKA